MDQSLGTSKSMVTPRKKMAFSWHLYVITSSKPEKNEGSFHQIWNFEKFVNAWKERVHIKNTSSAVTIASLLWLLNIANNTNYKVT